jgi:hypothetical protein
METIMIDNDINVLYVTAKSFPDGIMDAFHRLNELVPPSVDRRYFGISRPKDGQIIYRAAVEISDPDEAGNRDGNTLVLKKGKYISETIKDFMDDLPAIGSTFKKLLSCPGIDADGYCVEWYVNNKDVKCMVRLSE